MAGNTSVYDLPYLELGDAPDLAAGTKNLAEAVEDELIAVNNAVSNILSKMPPTVGVSDTTGAPISTNSTSPVTGSPVCGAVFVAPPSGRAYFTVSGHGKVSQNSSAGIFSYAIREGSTINAGALHGGAADSFRAVVVGRTVATASGITGVPQLGASRRKLFVGLTPGATYNVTVLMWVDPGDTALATLTVYGREILVEPAF